MSDGTGRMFPVDEDTRPHPQVSQGLAAMRRAQRPTLRTRTEQRLGSPAGLFARGRTAEADTDPGRPPGDPPGPAGAAEGSWETAKDVVADFPEQTPPGNDEVLHVTRGDLERLVDKAVAAALDPIAAAISDMRSAMVGQQPSVAAPPAPEDAEPLALLPLVDELPAEPVAALPIPEEHDWTQGKVKTFAPAPAQAAT